jgi:hypothetical protein
MKKTVFLTIIWLLCSMAAFAQPGKNMEQAEERIEAMRVAFITDKLRLTPEESQNFWPVYNQYQDELKGLRGKLRPKKEVFEMSDSEAENFIRDHLDMEQKELDLKRAYFERLRKVIPFRKIAMLGRLEQQFKEKLLQRIAERREGKQPGRPGLRN